MNTIPGCCSKECSWYPGYFFWAKTVGGVVRKKMFGFSVYDRLQSLLYIYVYRHMGDERGGKGVAASVNVGLSCPACRMRMMMILSAVCSCQQVRVEDVLARHMFGPWTLFFCENFFPQNRKHARQMGTTRSQPFS